MNPLIQLKTLLKNKLKGVDGMMINFYAMQIEYGWITLEQVPKKYRAKVRQLIEQANLGLDVTDKEG